jgi:hypothetical protein
MTDGGLIKARSSAELIAMIGKAVKKTPAEMALG